MKGQEKCTSKFASNLRELISQKGTTITALSKSLGISRQAVSQYADGTGQPNVDKLVMIADYFGVSADYLVGLSDIPARNETIQGIHNKTGLRQEAIVKLMIDKDTDTQETADFISYLVANEDFSRLIGEIVKLSEFHNTTIDATLGIGSDLYDIAFEAAFKIIATDLFWEIVKKYNNPSKPADSNHPITP